jgi:CHAD domain-containing protein
MTTYRTPIGLGKAIARWANRPPSRLRKPAHRPIVAPGPKPLAAFALGIGLSAAALLAVKEARRAGAAHRDGHLEERTPPPHKLALREGEHPPEGVRRMALAQLDLAIKTLKDARTADLQDAIHETRKAIKRVRTLERLTHRLTAGKRRRRPKTLLRQAARELSGARDAHVSLCTLEGLMRRYPKKVGTSSGVAALHAALLAERLAAEMAVQRSGARERAIDLLGAARVEIARAGPHVGKHDQAKALQAGATRIYAQGRRAMHRASKSKDIAEMHRWRKRVKDLRHTSEALGQGGRSSTQHGRATELRRLGREADRLGEALGEEHDLAMLAQRVSAENTIFRTDRRGRKALQKAIRRRRGTLRKRAFRSGHSLYGRTPKRFRRRLGKSR